MEDKFLKGIGSGLTAGIVTAIWNISSYYFHFATLRYLDFSAVLIYGRRPINTWESIFAWLGMLMFEAFMGIIFAYLSPLIKTRHSLLKGWFYGVLIWSGSYAITRLFSVPELTLRPLMTAISNLVGATIYGITLSLTLQWLNYREKCNLQEHNLKIRRYTITPQPVKKHHGEIKSVRLKKPYKIK